MHSIAFATSERLLAKRVQATSLAVWCGPLIVLVSARWVVDPGIGDAYSNMLSCLAADSPDLTMGQSA